VASVFFGPSFAMTQAIPLCGCDRWRRPAPAGSDGARPGHRTAPDRLHRREDAATRPGRDRAFVVV